MDAGIDGTRLGDPAAAQQLAEGAAVDLRSKARMRSQGTQFGGKNEAVTEPTVVERLLADAVAAEHQLALVSVPQCEGERSEEHTSELQSLMRISYAVFCLKKNITKHYACRYLQLA